MCSIIPQFVQNFGKNIEDPLELGLRRAREKEDQDTDKTPVLPVPPGEEAPKAVKLPEGKVCYPLLPPVTSCYLLLPPVTSVTPMLTKS